jgi:hypothetical protein
LEEDVEEEEAGTAGMLAGTIEKGMRTVLSTVARGGTRMPERRDQLMPPHATRKSSNDSSHHSHSNNNTAETNVPTAAEDGFEQLLRSRGVQPVHLSNATQL